MSFDFSRTVPGHRHRRELRTRVSRPNRGAYVGSHFLEQLETRALMDATLSMSLGVLYGADGNPLADNRAIVILVDAEGDGFGSHDSGTNFSTDSDDFVLTNTIFASNSIVGIPGVSSLPPLTFPVAAGLAGKQMKVLWFDKDVSQVTVAGGPGAGVRFGTYRTDAIQDGSDVAWFVPADGTTLTLNFFTDSIDGAGDNPESDGQVKFTTGGSGPVNQPPVLATIGSRTTAELTNLTFVAGANDPDAGNALTFSLDTASIAAGMTINSATGQFNWTPSEQQGPGLFNVTITVTDNGSPAASDSETFSIQVSEQNAAPVLAPIGSKSVAEGQSLIVNLSATDSDLPANGITLSVTGLPAFATFTNNGNGTGSITIDPGTTDAGSYNIQVTATDNDSPQLNDSETFVLTVTNSNVAPIAVDDNATTAEDTALTIAASALTANDTDIDGNPLTITAVGSAVNGTVSLSGSTITFTPAANFSGNGSFTYTISDGNGGSDTATVNVTISAVNDAPIAIDDTATTAEDTAINIAAATLFANDTDIDGGPLTITAVGGATNGSVSLAGSTITFTPAANFVGNGSFTYTISDGNGGTDTATVNVTVTAVNDAPVAIDDATTTAEDTALNIAAATLLTNDTDIDGGPLAITAVSNPSNGTVSLSGTTITFTPAANFSGNGSFTYTVSDGNGGSDTATVNVTITPVNDTPVAIDDSATTSENVPVAIAVLTNDTDVEGNTLTVISVSNPARGSAVINASGTITYTPDLNLTGLDTFTYTVSDGNGGSDTATVTVDVGGVNDAPVATNDSYSINEDGVLTVPVGTGVLANDNDIDGDTLSAVLVAGPTNGNLTLNANGSFTYTPNANFNGNDSFTYRASDGSLTSGIATVNITVTPVNDAPIANDDSGSTAEDTALNIAAATLTANDTDLDGHPLTITAVGTAVNGTVSLSGTTITFTPAGNFNGNGSFTYTIRDGNGGTDTATVTVSITPVNDSPDAVSDTATTAENTPVAIAVLVNDTDQDTDTLTISAFDAVSVNGGTITLNNGVLTYTPALDFNGADSFTYTVSDGNGGFDTATVNVNVNVGDVNDAPVATDDTASTDEDAPVNIAVLANDSDLDGDTLTIQSVTQPASGSVVVNLDNTITFTPIANFNGSDSFTYTVSDGNGSDTATVNITVNSVNDAPVATDDSTTTAEDTAIDIAASVLTANDTDIDSSPLIITAVSGAVGGTVALNGTTVTFTPNANFNGIGSFTYTVSDGNGSTDTATVTVAVTPVNDAPTAIDDSAATSVGTPLVINALTNDSDLDGNSLVVTAVTQGVSGTVTTDGATVTYTPAAGFIGTDTFSYTISDGNGGNATASITVNVTAASVTAFAISDSINALASLDSNTGLLTLIGELRDASGTLFDDVEAIAFEPSTGILFGVQQNVTAGNSTLVTINTANAQVTVIGVINAIDIDALTFDPSTGDLWGVEDTIEPTSGPTDPGRLVRIDKTTGAILQSVELIKPAVDPLDELDGFDPGIDGIAFEPTTGRLMAAYSAWGQIIRDASGNAIDVRPGIPSFLLEINKTTGQMTVVGNTGVKDIEEIAFNRDGVLHASLGDTGALSPALPGTFPGSFEGLVSLNTITGVATEVGSFGPAPLPVGPDQKRWDIEALAFVPLIVSNGASQPVAQPQPAMLQITTLADDATEGGSHAVFCITRTGDISEDLVVEISRSGSAKFGATGDYQFQCDTLNASSNVVTIPAGQSSIEINVVARDDDKVELDKQATLSIRRSANYQIRDNGGSASVTVSDNETRSLSINDVNIREGNDGVRTATFTIKLSAASSEEVTVDLATADGTAIAGLDYNTLAPTTITFAPGQTSVKVTVEVLGDLIDEDNQTFFVNLTNATNATIADDQGIATIKDNDAAPKILISDVTVIEGGTAQFEVTLSGVSERIITVDARTLSPRTHSGVAASGTDYTALNTTITFNPGDTSAFVNVDTLADGEAEVNERLSVTLRNASNGRIGDAIGIGTIVDSAAPTITIGDAQVAEPVEGSGLLTFDVNLSEPAASPVTVKFTVPPGVGEGKAGIFDIRPILVGTVTFEPGQTSRSIDVQVNSDQLAEGDETVTVTLLSSSIGVIADGQGVGTIIDDDEAPTISVNDVTIVEGNGGRKFALATVTLSKASGREVTVDVQTTDGTAVAGEDYSPVALATLSFLPGQTSKRLLIPILGDRIIEADETFAIHLSDATNATIASGQGIVTIQDND